MEKWKQYKFLGMFYSIASLKIIVQRSERQVGLSIANSKLGYFILINRIIGFWEPFYLMCFYFYSAVPRNEWYDENLPKRILIHGV
jgi:hypothetical protein